MLEDVFFPHLQFFSTLLQLKNDSYETTFDSELQTDVKQVDSIKLC